MAAGGRDMFARKRPDGHSHNGFRMTGDVCIRGNEHLKHISLLLPLSLDSTCGICCTNSSWLCLIPK